MIRVTIDLIPFGDEKNITKLSEIYIWNTTKIDAKGEFLYNFEGWTKTPDAKSTPIVGTVFHNRQNAVTTLLRKILEQKKGIV